MKKKLIELLNEYEDLSDAEECEKWCIDEYDRISEGGRRSQGTNNWICSKKFGFIKWLVDNDKIDFEKMEEQTKCKNIVGGQEFADFDIEVDFTPYEEVLMWLAIQEEPIKFLCSILK